MRYLIIFFCVLGWSGEVWGQNCPVGQAVSKGASCAMSDFTIGGPVNDNNAVTMCQQPSGCYATSPTITYTQVPMSSLAAYMVTKVSDVTRMWAGDNPANWAANEWLNVWNKPQGIPPISGISTISDIGVVGASRTGSLTTLTDAVGISGLAKNDQIGSLGSGAWGGTFTVDRVSGAQGPSQGIEIDVANDGSVGDVYPIAMHPPDLTVGLWDACGGHGSSFGGAGGTNNCSVAIGVTTNVQKWRKGIVFDATALDSTADLAIGKQIAMEMYGGQAIRWLNNINGVVSEMWGDGGGLNLYCNNQVLPASSATTLSICTNYSGGSGEIDFFNAQNNGGGLNFYQKTGASAAALLLSLTTSGGLVAGQFTANEYVSGSAAGVSCTAGTMSITTMVVTGGIVTHC